MIRWLCLFGFFTSILVAVDTDTAHLTPSSPELISGFYSGSDSLIGGVISPLGGLPVSSKTDLIARGAQNVSLYRVYIPPQVFPEPAPPAPVNTFGMSKKKRDKVIGELREAKILHFEQKWMYWAELRSNFISNRTGWRAIPHHWMTVWNIENAAHVDVYLPESNGAIFVFSLTDTGSKLESSSYGMSNASGDAPGGAYDPRNLRLARQGTQITVYCPDGTTRIYTPERPYNLSLKATFRVDYLLRKEILPNGKILRYSYEDYHPPTKERKDGYGYKLKRIESLDPQERYVYASLTIDGSLVIGTDTELHFTTNSGECAHYHLYQRNWEERFHGKNRWGKKSSIKLEGPLVFPPILSTVSSPFYRSGEVHHNFLMQMYSECGKDAPYSCNYSGAPLRVDSIHFPVGEKDAFLPLYTMTYDPPIPNQKGGQTVATRIDGSKTLYRFTSKFLPDLLQWYKPDGTLAKEKVVHWTDQQRLKGIEFKNENGSLFYARFFECDSFGNPEIETFEGNLSGQGQYEKHTIQRKYSLDGKNLLLQEENDEGKVTFVRYLPGTNLPTAKYIQHKNKILLREFFEYDDNNNLLEKIFDDGESEDPSNLTGVKQRTITRYRLRQEAPFLHCPEWVEELYWDGAKERVLKMTQLHYDKIGHVEEEEIYDSDQKFAYTIRRETDEQGNVLSETNSIGQIATTRYTSKGQPELLVPFSGRLEKKINYDLQGRSYRFEETGEGITHTTIRKHNALSQCYEQQDPFELSSFYKHDPITGHVTKTDLPPILSYEGQNLPISSTSEFDALGREISKTDPNGFTTTISYNAYGKPTLVEHPDGSQEKSIYYLDGKLKTAVDAEGYQTAYTYNIFGNVTSKTILSPKSELLSQETFIYKGLLLIESTDAENRTTFYTYDGAGRKIAQERGPERIEWTYDSLSRVRTTKTINGDQTLITISEYDLLSRPIEERKEDLTGKVLSQIFYEYDTSGNKSVITTWSEDKKIEELFTYDPFQRLIKHEDAIGFITTTEYDEKHLNSLGQRVLKKIQTDPMGLHTIDIHNALGNISSSEKKKDQTLNLEQFYYDRASNLTTQVSTIYGFDASQRVVTTRWGYDLMNRNALLTEAYDTMEAKTTRYTYTPRGQLYQTVKPDGIILERTYDGLGFQKSFFSSDGSLSYLYTYNRVGQLLELKDLLTGKSTVRDYDSYGRMFRETLANGLVLLNEYDSMNRRVLFTLPDKTSIEYKYDPLFLRQVSRLDSTGHLIYKHQYQDYDLSGHLLQQQSISDIGRMDFSYDGLGRRYQQSNSIVTHKVEEYDPRGNILQLLTHSPYGSDLAQYTYDDLSQLESESGLFANLYSFDSHNNRLQKNGNDYEINDLNQILEAEGEKIEYDLNGNPISKLKVTFQYDALDRLVEITNENTFRLNFSYDGLHRRLSKSLSLWRSGNWQPASCQLFLYDGQNEIGSVSPTGTIQELRILGSAPHAEIDAAIALELNGELYTPLHDLCGNVAYLVRARDNTLQESYRYTAFGEEFIFNSEKESITKTQVGNLWRFSSKRKDQETNLTYYGRRYYDPKIGRWLTPDPAGFADGLNLYAFVHNDPLTHFDEYGLVLQPRSPGTFNSYNITKNWGYDINQFSTGFNQGLVNAGFGVCRFANMATHAIASPFHAYDWQSKSFNFSMGNSYHSINSWLDQKQGNANNFLFSGGDSNNSAFRMGHFSGNLAGDFAMGSGIVKAARGVVSFGRSAFSPINNIVSAKAVNSSENVLNNTLTSYWPSNRGFLGEARREFLMPGTVVDRFGKPSGRFVSPMGTSFEARALPAHYQTHSSYKAYEILKPFEVNSGIVNPAFNQRGLGIQHELPISIEKLLKRNIMREVGGS